MGAFEILMIAIGALCGITFLILCAVSVDKNGVRFDGSITGGAILLSLIIYATTLVCDYSTNNIELNNQELRNDTTYHNGQLMIIRNDTVYINFYIDKRIDE